MAEEKRRIVAYLGPEASYTHQAALTSFPQSPTEAYTLIPQTTIADVFTAVQSGQAHHGVVPFENSSNGSVVQTLDLFADRDAKLKDIVVCGEAYVRVRHCLVVNKATTERGGSQSQATQKDKEKDAREDMKRDWSTPDPAIVQRLKGVTKIYSHPQAWGQCNVFLNTYLKGIERQDVSSTSRAAELVAQDATGTSAAVSSGMAAEVFGLGVAGRGIEDREGNCTRFLVLRRRDSKVDSHQDIAEQKEMDAKKDSTEKESAEQETEGDAENFKTLLSFTIDHHNPGALAASLSVFERYGINLTSINTRPSGVENWNYIFFVEVKGRLVEGEEGEEGAVNKALRDLGDVCRGLRWLGSWRNGLES